MLFTIDLLTCKIPHIKSSGGLGGKKDLSEYPPKMLFFESRELSDSRLRCLCYPGSLPVWGVQGPFPPSAAFQALGQAAVQSG